MKRFNRFRTIKFIVIAIAFVGSFVLNSNKSMAAVAISASCGAMTAQTPAWPVQTFKASCSATATGLTAGTTYKMGIYTSNYTTTKVSGNGSNITYNSNPPGHRFKVDGPEQGGTPANITTSSGRNSATKFRTGISGVTEITVPFDVYYTTYEGDYGDTAYRQPFLVRIYTNSATAATSATTNLDFTLVNRSYFTVSAPPSINLVSGLVFASNQDQDSNTMTVSVYANNTWTLQTLLAGNLISGSYNIPVTSNYFRASGAGFSNLASSKTQFAVANTYYNIAQNSAGVYRTGIAADKMYLTPVNISVIYNIRTTSAFTAGTYSNTTTFDFTSP